MRIILKIVAVTFFLLSIKINAQLDTLNYVKQFEINKVEYINKPFSYLLSHMTQLPPKTVSSMIGIWGKDLSKYSHFEFCSLEEQRVQSTVYMIVYWKHPVSRSQSYALSQQNHFLLTNDEKNFYGDKIVENIEVFKN